MYDTDHSDSGKPHVGEDVEVDCLSEFIVDDEVRSYEEEDVGCLLEVAFQCSVLGDLVANLEVAWGFHCFDYGVLLCSFEFGQGGCEGGLSCAWGSADEDPLGMVSYSLLQLFREFVLI